MCVGLTGRSTCQYYKVEGCVVRKESTSRDTLLSAVQIEEA